MPKCSHTIFSCFFVIPNLSFNTLLSLVHTWLYITWPNCLVTWLSVLVLLSLKVQDVHFLTVFLSWWPRIWWRFVYVPPEANVTSQFYPTSSCLCTDDPVKKNMLLFVHSVTITSTTTYGNCRVLPNIKKKIFNVLKEQRLSKCV